MASNEKERRQRRLQSDIDRLAREFDEEISGIGSSLFPRGGPDSVEADEAANEANYVTLFDAWKESAKNERLVARLVRIVPTGTKVTLRQLDPVARTFRTIDWPAEWESLRSRIEQRMKGDETRPGPMDVGTASLLEFPRFKRREGGEGIALREWVALELDISNLQKEVLPELVNRHLGSNGPMEFEAEVTMRDFPEMQIFSTSATSGACIQNAQRAPVLSASATSWSSRIKRTCPSCLSWLAGVCRISWKTSWSKRATSSSRSKGSSASKDTPGFTR